MRPGSGCTRWTVSCGTAICPGWAPASATATGCTAATTRRHGQRCNPAKLLLDPYAKAIEGSVRWDQAVFAYPFGQPDERNDADSAQYVPRSVVINPFFSWDNDRHPRTPYHETVIYEAHVRGLTKLHPAVPPTAARHLPGAGSSRGHRAPARSWRHRDRADAGAPVRQRRHPGRTRPGQLLGLQHDRVLRAAQRLRGQRCPRRAGPGVQVDGPHPAPGGHRGDPGRGLQPHRGGQPPRPDAVLPRHRQRGPTTGWSATTSGSTWTPPAPATAC